MKTIALIVVIICAATMLPAKADVGEEAQLATVLQSTATPTEKEDACRRLKQIGTGKSVPALALLLPDEHLYQAACDVLETMPAPEAGAALRAALKTTSGKPKAGIIHAIGERRDRLALSELAGLLSNSDPLVAMASAKAMGNIGGKEAVAALQNALASTTDPIRGAIIDALLHCASQLLTAGDRGGATTIFQQLAKPTEKEQVRVAAYVGLIRVAGNRELALVTSALEGTDTARQIAALPLARTIKDPKATKAFTSLLPKASPPMQMALLGVLQQRGDVAATPAVMVAASNADTAVRIAAIAALGTLGDATCVSLLADAAASSDEAEQKAARQALTDLRRGDVANTLVAQLATAKPAVQVELIRALSSRADKSAVPKLLELAQSDVPATRKAALRALNQLADGSNLAALVKLLAEAKDETARAEVGEVFESIVNRAGDKQSFDVAPIVQGLARGNTGFRIALLPVGALFSDAQLRAAFRSALADPDAQVRTAAAHALCNSRDPELMPDLLALVRSSTQINQRALALEGYVRLASEESSGFSSPKRVELLGPAFDLATRAEEKRLVLSALAGVPHPDALALAERTLANDEVKTEAEIACLRIAKALLPSDSAVAEPALKHLAIAASNDGVRTEAQALLKQFNSGWLYAGPYRQRDKQCRELFDIPFGPEQPGTNQVNWQRAPGSTDPARPNEAVLDGLVGGNDCVVYLKTRVFTPVAETVNFQIGSDDGVKLWVNSELVHANNAVRGLTPGQDQAKGKLRQGWNDLLAKITQSTAGCGMTLRIATPDEAEAPGLRFDPHGEALRPGSTGFRKIQLSDQFYAEGAYYGDFNRDGKLDLVAGPFWFEGPDFKTKHEYRPATSFNPREYSDNFLTYTADFNGDGWLDIFCVPFPGKEGFWYENPGNKDGHWSQHLAYAMVGNESPGWCDVTGNGQPDLIFNNEGYLGYATFDPAKPNEPWTFHAISPQDKRFQRFTHGIGAGDINGDGRVDLVEAAGWWEQPANLTESTIWKFHPHQFAEAASQMLVTDVDGDGLPDVINSWHCHLYGFVWHRQIRAANGEITWQQNIILPPKPDLKSEELRFSQLHAMDLVDMNDDGLKDVVTGKRFWAHGPAGDVEPNAPAVLYWFELRRNGDGKASFIPHLIDDDSGIGTQVTAVDINGDHRPDVIVANKKGIFVHLNESPKR